MPKLDSPPSYSSINCPLCGKEIEKPTANIDSYSYYQCKGFFVKINNETNKFVELYLYQKPIIVYFSHVEYYKPNWHVEINQKIVYQEDGYLSVEEAKQQLKRYKNLLVFS